MGDALKLVDWLKDNPGYAWMPVILLCVLVVLAYEVAKNLLPKLVEKATSSLVSKRATANQRIRTEAAMRNFCLVSRDRNWASTLPAVARYSLDIPLSEIFVLPHLATSGERTGGRAQEIGEILGDHRVLCVTGAPGAGKTTLINSLAIAFAKEDTAVRFRLVEARMPICFDFQEFVELGEGKPLEAVLSILFDRHGIAVPVEHLCNLLEQGRCAIFLDGLDEAGDAQHRRRILSWVIDSLSAFPSNNNRLVVTCRDFEWEAGATPGIARAIIQPFSVDQARAFVSKFQSALTRRSARPLSAATSHKFSALTDGLEDEYHFMSSNPMLLTLAVTLLTLDIPIPKKRSEILSHFLRTMLVDWEVLKKGAVKLTPEKDVLLKLERVGYCSLSKHEEPGTVLVRDRFVSDAISQNAGEAAAWLDQIASGSGILTRFSDAHWAFSNRRILEYLAAGELSRNPDAWTDRSMESAWKEVFTFLPEMAPDAKWYLTWLRRLGPANNDLHALLVGRAALALTQLGSPERNELVATVEKYIFSAADPAPSGDPDLTRAYLELKGDGFFLMLDRELVEIALGASQPHLVAMALRSNYLPAARHIANNLALLRGNVEWLAQMLPQISPSMRTRLLETLLQGDLPAKILVRPLVECGRDALAILTRLASSERHPLRHARLVELIAAFPDPLATTFLFKLSELGELGVDEREFLTANVRLVAASRGETAGDLLSLTKFTFYQRHGKRALDLFVSLVLGFLFLPAFVVVAMFIKLDSPGPVIVSFPRLGRAGREYAHLQFRSMHADLLSERAERAARTDPRVTRVGRLIRRTSLYELPAFINVIRGDIALIGPRPLPLYYANYADPINELARSRVRPGILGVSQSSYRESGSEYIGHQEAQDLEYLTRCSLRFDMALIARTFGQILFSKSAY